MLKHPLATIIKRINLIMYPPNLEPKQLPVPARIELEYRDMMISELKEEIFQLRSSQIDFDKVLEKVEELEEKCKEFDQEKVKIYS